MSDSLVELAQPTTGAVMRWHALSREAGALAKLAKRMGQRLRLWMEKNPEVMPDADVRFTFDMYTKAVLGLLKEQRERAKLAMSSDAPVISDLEFEKQLRELAKRTIAEMPEAELQAMLEERKK